MIETGITKNQIMKELTKSPHGKFGEYVPVGSVAAREEAEFFAHLIAWNQIHGEIRDSKVAMPIVALSQGQIHEEFAQNALAHMASMDPRNLLRGTRFVLAEQRMPGYMNAARRMVKRYLRARELNHGWWVKTAVQHRKSLKSLYALFHVKPSPIADWVLFKRKRPTGSVFEQIAQLKNMSPREAAGTILEKEIPFLIAMGAMGKKIYEPDVVLALIERMSPPELMSNMKLLVKLGVNNNPALRGALDKALGKTEKSGKKNMLKATVAAAAVTDEVTREKLKGTQERQMQTAAKIKGRWAVLVDKSTSMVEAIEAGRQIAAMLAKMVEDQVHLIFFDTAPRAIEATGKTYDQILMETRHVEAKGGTSIGVGLAWLLANATEVDGIAIVSDAAENNPPMFSGVYELYSEHFEKQVPVYLYRLKCGQPWHGDIDLARSMRTANFDLQEFDLRGGVDYYSLPNLVATMRVNRYSLIDEVMATPLLTLNEVFK